MDELKRDLERYGDQFQEQLAQLILSDRKFADQIGQMIKPEYFSIKCLRTTIDLFYKHKGDYGTYPTHVALNATVGNMDGKAPALKTACLNFIQRSANRKEAIPDESFIRDQALKFCHYQKIMAAVGESYKLITTTDDTSQYDLVRGIINDALRAGADHDLGHDYLEDIEQRFGADSRRFVPTPWPRLNLLMQGGLGAGELGIIMAPTNGGKSFVLINLGAGAMKMGYKVAHITLEDDVYEVGNRYDACLCEVSLNHIKESKEIVMQGLKDIPGKLLIKQYPTKRASVGTLRNYINHLIAVKEFRPDLLIVDYGDILKSNKYDSLRFGLQEIFEELRALGQEYDFPVWTATQTNRSGSKKELVDLDDMSEAFAKAFNANFVFGLSRSREDEENGVGKLLIGKNKKGPKGVVLPLEVDLEYAKINVSKGEYIPADEGNGSGDRFDSAYKAFMESRK
jgi:archaellum biogenesis ATPase FlaH